MSTSTAETILNALTDDFTEYAVYLVPIVLTFAVGVWGLKWVIRKAFGAANRL
jgi:hypothetical protein